VTTRIYRRRLPHIQPAGHVFFVTFRLSPRQVKVLCEAEREAMVAHIQRMGPGRCHSFVVMPDHVHIVYQPGEGEDLRRSLQALKGASSHALTRGHGRSAPVW
jgi:REP element-mobilizing transposase RayT